MLNKVAKVFAGMSKERKKVVFSIIGISVMLGAMLVLLIFLIRTTIFNAQVMSERSASIESLSLVQNNINKIRDAVDDLGKNPRLEYFAGSKSVECYNEKGEVLKNFPSKSVEIRCKAARSLGDILPSEKNNINATILLNRIIGFSGEDLVIKALDVKEEKGAAPVKSGELGNFKVKLEVFGSEKSVRKMLNLMAKSVRRIDAEQLDYEIVDGLVNLKAELRMYYQEPVDFQLHDKTLRAGVAGALRREGR